MNIDIEKTFKKAVGENTDFHFYVDELTNNDYMPTYMGEADEKYTFNELNDEFFEFIKRKASSDGVYIRIINAIGKNSKSGAEFLLECGNETRTFRTQQKNVLVFDFADFGVKIKGNEIFFGTTVSGGCGQTPYFAEFGSSKGNQDFLSLENPLNKFVLGILKSFIVYEV